MSQQQPLVSIIIPTFNRAHLIGETLDSVLDQTYTNWECIIVDDGSTDNTFEVVSSYVNQDARFKFSQRPDHKLKGANACRNLGHDASKGVYLMFLDSDDLITNQCIENRLKFFFENHHFDFIVSNTGIYCDGNYSTISINNDCPEKNSYQYALLFLRYKSPWAVMSVLWKKNSIKDFYFDENLSRFQDVDFHIQILLKNKFVFGRLLKIDNYYRDSSLEKKEDRMYILRVVTSFFILIDKIALLAQEDVNIKISFKRFLYIISRDFIFFNKITETKDVNKFFKKLKQYMLLDLIDMINFHVMYLFKLTNAFGKKGYGVFTFLKYTNRYYNKNI